jgi:hypothetical protein
MAQGCENNEKYPVILPGYYRVHGVRFVPMDCEKIELLLEIYTFNKRVDHKCPDSVSIGIDGEDEEAQLIPVNCFRGSIELLTIVESDDDVFAERWGFAEVMRVLMRAIPLKVFHKENRFQDVQTDLFNTQWITQGFQIEYRPGWREIN